MGFDTQQGSSLGRAKQTGTAFTISSPDGNSFLDIQNHNAQIESASSNGIDFSNIQCTSNGSGQCDLIIENSSNGVDSTITMGDASIIIAHDVKIAFVAPKYNFHSIPTSSAGLSAGDIWSNGGILTIV